MLLSKKEVRYITEKGSVYTRTIWPSEDLRDDWKKTSSKGIWTPNYAVYIPAEAEDDVTEKYRRLIESNLDNQTGLIGLIFDLNVEHSKCRQSGGKVHLMVEKNGKTLLEESSKVIKIEED